MCIFFLPCCCYRRCPTTSLLLLICCCCLFVYIFTTHIYKQKSGRMNSSGNRTGTTSRLRPQVQQLLRRAKKMIPKMDKLTMKHPPRWRCQTTIVVVVLLLLLPSSSGVMTWLKMQSSSRGFPCHTMHRSDSAADAFPRVVVVVAKVVVEGEEEAMLCLLDDVSIMRDDNRCCGRHSLSGSSVSRTKTGATAPSRPPSKNMAARCAPSTAPWSTTSSPRN